MTKLKVTEVGYEVLGKRYVKYTKSTSLFYIMSLVQLISETAHIYSLRTAVEVTGTEYKNNNLQHLEEWYKEISKKQGQWKNFDHLKQAAK